MQRKRSARVRPVQQACPGARGALAKHMPAVWWTMNQTADFVAQKYNISRDALDTYVVESQRRVEATVQRDFLRMTLLSDFVGHP
jgi:acetyl-CoA acetyltransferase